MLGARHRGVKWRQAQCDAHLRRAWRRPKLELRAGVQCFGCDRINFASNFFTKYQIRIYLPHRTRRRRENMMNTSKVRFAALCLLAVLSGCEKIRQEPQPQLRAKTDSAVQQNPAIKADEKYSCEDLLKEVIFSSNLEAVKKFRALDARTEGISAEKIIIELYARETSDRTGELRTVENTVGWLEFIPESRKLNDVTADPDSPVELSYDKTIFARHSLSEICGLKTSAYFLPQSIG